MYKICACAPYDSQQSCSRKDEANRKINFKGNDNILENNEENKTERVHFRVTKEEKRLISERAKSAGMSISKYILNLSERKRMMNPEPVLRLWIEINRIRNNINQIVRVANSVNNISEKEIDILEKQMEYLHSKAKTAIDFLLEREEQPPVHSPITIKYHLKEIERLVYELINKQDQTGNE